MSNSTFDRSPLGAFTQSPLGARNKGGAVSASQYGVLYAYSTGDEGEYQDLTHWKSLAAPDWESFMGSYELVFFTYPFQDGDPPAPSNNPAANILRAQSFFSLIPNLRRAVYVPIPAIGNGGTNGNIQSFITGLTGVTFGSQFGLSDQAFRENHPLNVGLTGLHTFNAFSPMLTGGNVMFSYTTTPPTSQYRRFAVTAGIFVINYVISYTSSQAIQYGRNLWLVP